MLPIILPIDAAHLFARRLYRVYSIHVWLYISITRSMRIQTPAETIATYDIIALSDNFSSEDGLCYKRIKASLQSLLKQIKLTFKKLPTLHILSALKIPS